MKNRRKFLVFIAIVFSLFLVGNSKSVNANDFEDVKDIPFTTPVNP